MSIVDIVDKVASDSRYSAMLQPAKKIKVKSLGKNEGKPVEK